MALRAAEESSDARQPRLSAARRQLLAELLDLGARRSANAAITPLNGSARRCDGVSGSASATRATSFTSFASRVCAALSR